MEGSDAALLRCMTTHDPQLFTPDYRESAFWLDALAEQPAAEGINDSGQESLPATADVVVIGSGYTGLHAALSLARAGRQVLVFESGEIGHGCSRRNGGQVSSAIKPDLATLTRRYGHDAALALLREGVVSVDWLESFLLQENISCEFIRCGSFHGAHSARQFQQLRTSLQTEHPEFKSGAWLVEPSAMHKEIGTSAYHGGAVYPREGSIQPALYHQALIDKALQSGVSLHARCPVLQVESQGQKSKDRVRVQTGRGSVLAREVVVATNGYTGDATPWLQRRIIPIGSYMIATEPLSTELMDQILPTNRVICDTRKVVYYYRPSPDRRRVIFGGRVSAREVSPDVSGPLLHQSLSRLFPQLAHTRISHSWSGKVAFTFDDLAHRGSDRHIHYALGYCGSGIAMSS
nr:FAD-binding oxidoreductase [Granulosicoccus sp.]